MSRTETTNAYEKYQGSPGEIYERYFVPTIGAPSAEGLLDLARLQSGEAVLDVACGTGIATRLAAEQVGPKGSVTGVDLTPGMLEVARRTVATSTPSEWHVANAEDLPLPSDTFDVALCSLGLQFFPDKVAALSEMARVLKPGGRVAVGLPGPTPPVFAILDEALARHVGPQAAGFVHAVFSLHEPDEVRGLFEAAGFRDVEVRTGVLDLRLPPPADLLWQYVQATPLSALVAGVDDRTRQELEQDVVTRWQPFVEGDEVVMPAGMTFAGATQ